MARPRRHIEGRQISLRLDAALLAELDARAHELGVDRSQLINRLVKNNLDTNPWAETADEAAAKYNQAGAPARLPNAADPIPGPKRTA